MTTWLWVFLCRREKWCHMTQEEKDDSSKIDENIAFGQLGWGSHTHGDTDAPPDGSSVSNKRKRKVEPVGLKLWIHRSMLLCEASWWSNRLLPDTDQSWDQEQINNNIIITFFFVFTYPECITENASKNTHNILDTTSTSSEIYISINLSCCVSVDRMYSVFRVSWVWLSV